MIVALPGYLHLFLLKNTAITCPHEETLHPRLSKNAPSEDSDQIAGAHVRGTLSHVVAQMFPANLSICALLGPVFQSVVSLTTSLRVISLTVLAHSIYNILILFAKKMCCKSYSHFFSKKFQHICVSFDVNLNESLTNDVVSFEQLGLEVTLEPRLSKERTAKTLICLEVSFPSDFCKRTRN